MLAHGGVTPNGDAAFLSRSSHLSPGQPFHQPKVSLPTEHRNHAELQEDLEAQQGSEH